MIGIYILTCIPTGLQYVGQSIDVKRRIHQHFRLNASGCKLLHQAFLEYGTDAFTYKIIECHPYISKPELVALERKYIRELKTLNPNGYNLTKGGQGQSLDQETKDKIGNANRGRKLGPRSQKSIEKQKQFYRENKHHNSGTRHSQETKDKISRTKRQMFREKVSPLQISLFP